jgi:DNA-directed RNA polymerase omega subunit
MDNRGPAIDSKFRRVLVAAHRAEQLMKGARAKVESGKRKPTRVAMEEVDRSLVEWGYGPPPQPEQEQPLAEGAEGAEGTEQPVPAEVH